MIKVSIARQGKSCDNINYMDQGKYKIKPVTKEQTLFHYEIESLPESLTTVMGSFAFIHQ